MYGFGYISSNPLYLTYVQYGTPHRKKLKFKIHLMPYNILNAFGTQKMPSFYNTGKKQNKQNS